MARNRNPQRRGFSRNGAPAGYGQQQGESPFLDQPQQNQPEEGDGREPIFAHQRNAPAAPQRPEPEPQQFEDTMQPPQEQPGMMQSALQRRPMTAAQIMQPIGQGAQQSQGRGMQPQPGQAPQAQAIQQALGGGPQTAAQQAFQPQPPMQAAGKADGVRQFPQEFEQPQSSTGSGAFGAGARLPGGPQGPLPTQFTHGPQGTVGEAWNAMGQQFNDRAQLPQGGQDPAQGGQGSLADAARAAAANNYTDIAGAERIAAGNYQGQLEGFGNIDPGGERGSNTHKKLFGRIASRYDVTQPGAVRTMMQDPDFQAAFPDARLVEHPNADLIDFGDGNPVDVIRGAVEGGSGEGWQWGVDAGQGAPGGGGQMGPGQFMPSDYSAGPEGDLMSRQLMAALQGGGGQFGDGSVSIEQLLAALGLGQQAQPIMNQQQTP